MNRMLWRAAVLSAFLSCPPIDLPFAAVEETAPASLPDLVAAYDDLDIEPETRAVEGVRLELGHLTALLQSGRASRVSAGGETIGLFFKGKGEFEYVSNDPIEFPVVRFNAERSTALRPEKRGDRLTIKDAFDTLLILSPGSPSLGGQGSAGGSLLEDFNRHRRRFLRDRKSLASHQLALWRLNAPASVFSRAEISGREDIVHLFDPAVERAESLYVLEKLASSDPEIRKWLWPIPISEVPIGRDRRDPAMPHYFLFAVDYTLIASGGREAALSVKETIAPVSEGQRVLSFDFYNVDYDFVGPDQKREPRYHHLRSVKDGSGRLLPFEHRQDALLVDLGAPAPVDRPLRLQFEIDGDFLIRPHRDNYWALGAEPWFPQPESSGQAFTLHSTIKVRKPFVPFAPGRTIARSEEGNYNVVENRIDDPVEHAVALAGKYEYSEQQRSGFTVRVASYAGTNPRAWESLGSLAFEVMDFYQPFLGPFPCTELNIIEINAYGFTQAPPCTMFITKEAFQPALGAKNQYYSRGINKRFAHEIAHQYWGHVVKVPSHEEVWLSEAFAEYCAGMFIKDFEGESSFRQLLTKWRSSAEDSSRTAPIALATRIRIKDDYYVSYVARDALLYAKGAWLLARLHAGMEDESFRTFLRSYQSLFRWKFGSTKHMVGMLKAVTGKDYAGFFERNYWGTEMPE